MTSEGELRPGNNPKFRLKVSEPLGSTHDDITMCLCFELGDSVCAERLGVCVLRVQAVCLCVGVK